MTLQSKAVLTGVPVIKAWLVGISLVLCVGSIASVALAQRPPAAPAQRAPAAPEKPRIAILEFQGVEASRAELASATDQLRDDVVKTGKYTVLDRSQISSVLGEQAFQREGVTDASQAVELGKLLNVEFIVTGRLTRLPGAYQLSAQLVEVRTARVAHTETIRQRGEFLQFLDSLTPLAARMTGTAAAQVAAAPRAPESAPPQAPAPSAPGPAGFPAPFSVYGNAIPLDPQRRTFVEVSAGSFERELTGTYTFDFNYGLGTEKSDPFDIKMKITRSTVYTGFGAGESGLMRLGVGTISVQDTESTSSDETLQGRELVVDYRTIIGQSQGTSRGVFFASYRGGNLENDFYTGTFAQIDLGGGVTVRTSETISLYGGVVLSSLAAKLEATPLLVSETNVELVALGFLPNSLNAATLDAKAKTTMGLIFGLTAHLGASANLGLELHSGHESGTALNIGILF